MSSRNKHSDSTWTNEVNNRKCPKKNCQGTLIHCTVRYVPRGPLCEELECSDCGLIKKDPRWKKRGPIKKTFGQTNTQEARLSNRR